MGQLTTHVLDIAHGQPAAFMQGQLLDADGGLITSFTTDAQGRCEAPLLSGGAFIAGRYTLVFHSAAYFRARGVALPEPPFLDEVRLAIGIADAAAHYHVPLLVSPWSFSTYRGG